MNWTPICALADIVPHTGVGALVDGHQVAVFRLDDDSIYAIDNFDPRSRANVLARGIVGDIGGEIVVASPIYKQHVRLSDGVCLEDDTHSVTAHKAVVRDGQVLVQLASAVEQAA